MRSSPIYSTFYQQKSYDRNKTFKNHTTRFGAVRPASEWSTLYGKRLKADSFQRNT